MLRLLVSRGGSNMAWYYYAGGAAVLGLGAVLMRGGKKQGSDSESAPGATPMGAPLFMASGGGSNQAGTADGVSNWTPPKVPLSDNPDVAIANINAGVQMAAINAATKLQEAAIIQATPPPNTVSNKTEYRGNSIQEGAAYIKDLIRRTPGAGNNVTIEQDIYAKAKAHNYSATETAQAYSDATGTKVSVSQVSKWLSDRGLTL